MKSSWDYLDLLPDKKSIINFLKKEVWTSCSITKSRIEFFICETESKRLQEIMQKHLDKQSKEDIQTAEEVDRLAVQFNNAKDIKTKINLLEKREKLIDKLRKSHKEWERINKLQDENHKYWEKIYAESKKEEDDKEEF